jgi:hypothetical protein
MICLCVLSLLFLIVIIENDSNNNSSEVFIMQQIEIEIRFQRIMYYPKMEYIPLTKLFRNDYYIVTVKLINKIFRSA